MPETRKTVHLTGVGGTGMSGLASIYLRLGFAVSGSDVSSNAQIEKLMSKGLVFGEGHSPENVPDNADFLVYSAAVKDDNAERARAAELGIPELKYAEALGELTREKKSVCIAGTHGKTTMTSMAAYLFEKAGLSPSYVVGGEVRQLNSSSAAGDSEFFIVESCEFDRSFLSFSPYIAVVANIDADHLDYFKSVEDIEKAFAQFVANIRPEGKLIYCADDERVRRIADGFVGAKTGYGFSAGVDARILDYSSTGEGSVFSLSRDGHNIGVFRTALAGSHNVLNAAAVVICAVDVGVSPETAAEILETFEGAGRRWEVTETSAGITLIDDFAHHPAAVEAALKAAISGYRGRRVVCVFQPHQYSRTRLMMDEFARALSLAEKVVLPEIFAARDSAEDIKSVSSRDLARAVRVEGGDAAYFPGLGEAAEFLSNNLDDGDVVVTMGAGDVWKVGDELRERFQ